MVVIQTLFPRIVKPLIANAPPGRPGRCAINLGKVAEIRRMTDRVRYHIHLGVLEISTPPTGGSILRLRCRPNYG